MAVTVAVVVEVSTVGVEASVAVASTAAAVSTAADPLAAIAAEDDRVRCTEVVAGTETRAEVFHRRATPVQRGVGPGRAEVGPVTVRRAGIRLPDQLTAPAWAGDPAVGVWPDELAVEAWPQPEPDLPTGGGTPSEAPTARVDLGWPPTRDWGQALRSTMLVVWEPAAPVSVDAVASMADVEAFTGAEATVGVVGAIRVSALVGGSAGVGVGIPSGTGHRPGITHGGTTIHRATFTRIPTSEQGHRSHRPSVRLCDRIACFGITKQSGIQTSLFLHRRIEPEFY
jgi:hypothetical protein